MNASPKSTTPPLRLAWTIWGWGAAFYLVGFFLRVTPAVMTAELMQAFNISATAIWWMESESVILPLTMPALS